MNAGSKVKRKADATAAQKMSTGRQARLRGLLYIMRLYQPGESLLKNEWKSPQVTVVK